jgi:hypothetical protein
MPTPVTTDNHGETQKAKPIAAGTGTVLGSSKPVLEPTLANGAFLANPGTIFQRWVFPDESDRVVSNPTPSIEAKEVVNTRKRKDTSPPHTSQPPKPRSHNGPRPPPSKFPPFENFRFDHETFSQFTNDGRRGHEFRPPSPFKPQPASNPGTTSASRRVPRPAPPSSPSRSRRRRPPHSKHPSPSRFANPGRPASHPTPSTSAHPAPIPTPPKFPHTPASARAPAHGTPASAPPIPQAYFRPRGRDDRFTRDEFLCAWKGCTTQFTLQQQSDGTDGTLARIQLQGQVFDHIRIHCGSSKVCLWADCRRQDLPAGEGEDESTVPLADRRTFYDTRNARRHVFSCHLELDYQCTRGNCPRTFNRHSSLVTHLKTCKA